MTISLTKDASTSTAVVSWDVPPAFELVDEQASDLTVLLDLVDMTELAARAGVDIATVWNTTELPVPVAFLGDAATPLWRRSQVLTWLAYSRPATWPPSTAA